MNSQELVSVTVTYRPNVQILRRQLLALPDEMLKVLVDNSSGAEAVSLLRAAIFDIPNVKLVENSENVGLAAALNQGVVLANKIRPAANYCLLLDQDSEPQIGSVVALHAGLEGLLRCGVKVGCVGPQLIDEVTGLPHGFHSASKWFWHRVYPPAGSTELVPCANLNGSGTLMPIDIFLGTRGLDESLFIDHVDTEWSFRLRARGYTLWGIPDAVFLHRMGEGSLRYWLFGWHVWPQRSPQRHYYLFRNALWLMKRPYVDNVWKFWAMVKLMLTFVVHALFDPQRGRQMRSMLKGLGRGLRAGSTSR